ncbi:MAG: hypothetical protein Q9182_001894 [Xanthomendoza sp. 2 TL-2023]
MLALLVLKTSFAIMRWPSKVTPATFDLIGMIGAVVEMISHAIVGKGAATASRHIGWRRDPVSHQIHQPPRSYVLRLPLKIRDETWMDLLERNLIHPKYTHYNHGSPLSHQVHQHNDPDHHTIMHRSYVDCDLDNGDAEELPEPDG